MNCYQHPERAAVAYCRTCGRPLCSEDQREIYGVVYCQPCLAQRIGQPTPEAPPAVLPETHSPGLAFLLGLIPGVGAVYNGQYFKAFMQVVIFAFLIFLTNSTDSDSLGTLFGLFIAVFYFYMPIDSYRTAKAIALGRRVEDPFALGTASVNAPWAAIILIVIGGILLLNRLGWFALDISRFLWPILLIAAGLYMILRHRGLSAPPAAPIVPPPVAPMAPPPIDPGTGERPNERL